MPEGTIVRVITRLDETCREVRDAARVIGDAELFKKMEESQIKIKRDSKPVCCFFRPIHLLMHPLSRFRRKLIFLVFGSLTGPECSVGTYSSPTHVAHTRLRPATISNINPRKPNIMILAAAVQARKQNATQSERRVLSGMCSFYFRFFTGVSSFLSPPAGATGADSVFFLSSGVGASVFFADYEGMSVRVDNENRCTYLGNRRLGATNKAERSTEHAEERDDGEHQDGADLGLCLECEDGIELREVNELERLAADELDRVLREGDFLLLIDLLGVRLRLSLLDFEGLLDVEGLRLELARVLNGVADIDVVEEDVLRHRPELNTNTTL